MYRLRESQLTELTWRATVCTSVWSVAVCGPEGRRFISRNFGATGISPLGLPVCVFAWARPVVDPNRQLKASQRRLAGCARSMRVRSTGANPAGTWRSENDAVLA